jgi:hypothetical protein
MFARALLVRAFGEDSCQVDAVDSFWIYRTESAFMKSLAAMRQEFGDEAVFVSIVEPRKLITRDAVLTITCNAEPITGNTDEKLRKIATRLHHMLGGRVLIVSALYRNGYTHKAIYKIGNFLWGRCLPLYTTSEESALCEHLRKLVR